MNPLQKGSYVFLLRSPYDAKLKANLTKYLALYTIVTYKSASGSISWKQASLYVFPFVRYEVNIFMGKVQLLFLTFGACEEFTMRFYLKVGKRIISK